MYYSIRYLKEQPRAAAQGEIFNFHLYTKMQNQKQNYQQVINISTFYQQVINILSTYQQVINMKGGFRGYGVTRACVYARAREGGGWLLAGD